MKPRTVEALPEHAYELSRCMRRHDADELAGMSGQTPLEGLMEALAVSEEAYTTYFGDEIAAMWGVCPFGVLDPIRLVWCLTGRVVDRYPVTFVRESHRALRRLRKFHPMLINCIDARYGASVRWAEKIGFSVGEAIPLGIHGLGFHPITLGAA